MAELVWDAVGERWYETGVDKAVLYVPDIVTGVYSNGYAWNGVTGVTESPTGGESNKQYANNKVYLNLTSAEQFAATLEAFTYPDQFAPFDGQKVAAPGVLVGQQRRPSFGLSYRTLVGNDTLDTEAGYLIHLVYGCKTAPSEKARATVNENPEATPFSWELSTTPVDVGTIDDVYYAPTSHLTIDSRTTEETALATLEGLLYGTAGSPGSNPSLPLPEAVIAMFATP